MARFKASLRQRNGVCLLGCWAAIDEFGPALDVLTFVVDFLYQERDADSW